MATIEQRVNVALDGATLNLIKEVANITNRSLSKVCADLIKKQLEDDEDVYYIKLLNEMDDFDAKPKISFAEMHRRLNELSD